MTDWQWYPEGEIDGYGFHVQLEERLLGQPVVVELKYAVFAQSVKAAQKCAYAHATKELQEAGIEVPWWKERS